MNYMMTILSKRWAFDTNVLVYFLDKDSPFHESAVKIFEHVERDGIKVLICQQNILELVQSMTKDYGLTLARAVKVVKRLVQQDVLIVRPFDDTIDTYFNLCGNYSGSAKKHFDLYLAATLLDNGVDTLVTADDSGFKSVSRLKCLGWEDFENRRD